VALGLLRVASVGGRPYRWRGLVRAPVS